MAGETAIRSPRWMRILLVLSLAANLAVLGLVAGFVLSGPPDRERGFFLPIDGIRGIQSAMPEEDRDRLRAAMREARPAFRQGRRALRGLRGEFLDALRADPFSEARLVAVLEAQSAIWSELGGEARTILADHVAGMSPEARQAFADALEAAMSRRVRSPGPSRD